MNNCENDILHIVKGDDVYLAVTIIQPDGQEYVMQDGDVLHFQMKQNADSSDAVIDKQNITNEVIHLQRGETKLLETGRYVYDVKLVQTDNDTIKVTTIIPLSNALVHSTTHTID